MTKKRVMRLPPPYERYVATRTGHIRNYRFRKNRRRNIRRHNKKGLICVRIQNSETERWDWVPLKRIIWEAFYGPFDREKYMVYDPKGRFKIDEMELIPKRHHTQLDTYKPLHRRRACPRGHIFFPENTRSYELMTKGEVHCRACRNAREWVNNRTDFEAGSPEWEEAVNKRAMENYKKYLRETKCLK